MSLHPEALASRLTVCALAGLLVACPATAGPARDGNLLQNPDFELPGSGVPERWTQEAVARHKGEVLVVGRAGGSRVLVLRPNAANVVAELKTHPLGVGQVVSLKDNPELRGKTLYLSGELAATAPAKAVLRVIGIRLGGEFIGTTLEQGDSGGALVVHDGSLAIPDDARTLFLVVGLDAHGTGGEVSFDNVSLGTTPRASASSAPASTAPLTTARIAIDAARRIRTIPEELYGVNIEWIWDASGLWDKDHSTLDEEAVRLTRELRPTLLRFPGGFFADFYHWRDGIGPREQRPTRPHMPGGPTSKNDFGTDEALEFARRTGAELMITANVATGTPEEAVEWLRYVNRPGQTAGQPPVVRFWEIGNENYYKGGPPYVREAALDAQQYTQRFTAFARALKAADPRISVIAITEENYEQDFEPTHPDWTRRLLSDAGREVDYLAVHNGYVPRLESDRAEDLRTVYGAMLAAPLRLRQSLDRVSAQAREHAAGRGSPVGLAITEWGPSFQLDLKGRYLDHPKTLGSALFVAANLMNYIEDPDVRLANYFKLSDRLWQGLLGLHGSRLAATAPYYAFRMFREHFGRVLVETKTASPTWNARAAGYVPALRDVPYLAAVCSVSEDGQRLQLMVVNKHFDEAIQARIEIRGFEPQRTGRSVVLSGSGIDAHTGTQLFTAPGVKWAPQAEDAVNPRFAKGAPDEITVTEHALSVEGSSFAWSFEKHSLTAIELERARPGRRAGPGAGGPR
jgi:alpha-L-arabinofuranosidase